MRRLSTTSPFECVAGRRAKFFLTAKLPAEELLVSDVSQQRRSRDSSRFMIPLLLLHCCCTFVAGPPFGNVIPWRHAVRAARWKDAPIPPPAPSPGDWCGARGPYDDLEGTSMSEYIYICNCRTMGLDAYSRITSTPRLRHHRRHRILRSFSFLSERHYFLRKQPSWWSS